MRAIKPGIGPELVNGPSRGDVRVHYSGGKVHLTVSGGGGGTGGRGGGGH